MATGDEFVMPRGLNDRKAWWGVRYVSAVCAQAGLVFQETAPQSDVYSLDGQVYMRPGLAVSVQIKCTSKPITRQQSYPIKAAWRKNWTELDLPGYFVVVSVPTDTSNWIRHGGPQWSTVLRSAAFWTRIDPLDPDLNSITVHTSQRLTVATMGEWASDLQAALLEYGGGVAS